MSDHIEALHLSRDFLLSLRKYGGVDAVEWALDQLRWRDVREELPGEEGGYLVLCDGDYQAEIDRWIEGEWEVNRGFVLWWRPVTLPESTQTPSDGRDGV